MTVSPNKEGLLSFEFHLETQSMKAHLPRAQQRSLRLMVSMETIFFRVLEESKETETSHTIYMGAAVLP